MTKLPLRPNVCMLLLNGSSEVFVGERLGQPGVWQLPQGGIDAPGVEDGGAIPRELEEESVYRELEEEIGVPRSKLAILARLPVLHEYEFRAIPSYARGRWLGQSQRFYVVRFNGSEGDIALDTHKPQEFAAYRWVALDKLLEVTEPIRHEGYRKALAALRVTLLLAE